MLIDVELLPIKCRADEGDPEAQVAIMDAFYIGKGVPVDFAQAKKYLIMLSQNDPDDLPQLGYGTLLYFIGDACHRLGQMEEANEWYEKSMDYFRETYIEDFANELIEDYKLKSLIAETERKIGSI